MLLGDLRYAARSLRRAPIFTAAAVLTLGLGIGVNTSMFSVLDAELLRPLPFRDPTRLVRVAERNDKLHLPDWTTSVLNYMSWKEKQRCFEQLGAIGNTNFALTGLGDPEQFVGNTLTPGLLGLLGIRPVIGREFHDDEDKPESARVAMISEALWRKRFQGSTSVVGEHLSLNGQVYVVVGVVPSSIFVVANGDIFSPLLLDPPHEIRLSHTITAVARLKPDLAISQAQAEMEIVAAQVGHEYPAVRDWSVRLFTFSDWFAPPPLRAALYMLMGAVVLVLCIASANVASLLLAKAVSRQQEVAIRVALGASRADLLRQFLVESLLLAIGGGVLGVLLAAWAVHLMTVMLPADLLPIPNVRLDAQILLFSAGLTVLTALAFGLAPGWYAARMDLNSLLKQGSRGSTASHSLLHRALVAGELALATVLLIGAGLLLQTLLRLQHVNVGFDASHVLTFELSPPAARYPNQVQAWAFYQRLIAGLEAQPGVLSAAISSCVPFGGGTQTRTPMAPVGPSLLAPDQSVPIDWRTVSPDYLQTMKIPLRSGRFFSMQDATSSPGVAVVDQRTAAMLWGKESPLERKIRIVGSGVELTVIGVTGAVVNTSLNETPVPAVYYASSQRLWPSMDVAVRTQGDPEHAIDGARRVLRGLDPEMPMANVKTVEQWIAASAAQPRLNASLVAVFAASALLIGAIGIYGVLSFSVSQRKREIGVRLALGAQRTDVVKLIFGEGMVVMAIGIAAGVCAAAALGRAISSLLFEVRAHDPAAFLIASLVLAAAAALASYLPAYRASRLDPADVLRSE